MGEKKVLKRAKKSQNQAKYKKFAKEQRKEEKRLAKKRKKLRDKKQMQMLEVANSRTNTKQSHAKKKKHKRNYTLYYIMLAFFIAITGVVLSVTILFNIQNVTILDTSIIPNETFAYVTGIEVGDNLFRINPETAAKKLINSDLTLDSVTIKRKFPSTVEVSAVKCEPTSVVESEGLMYVLSQSGRLIEVLEQNIYPQIMCISINAPENFKVGDYLDPMLYSQDETVSLILSAI
ncbi:MAG: FtsQ-type POTRA domain-containing protein [Oscillospiraceae bacterium]|nr:FtsQ-type POTRA domain-containing protein [Oscillospiraceae bacterium]